MFEEIILFYIYALKRIQCFPAIRIQDEEWKDGFTDRGKPDELRLPVGMNQYASLLMKFWVMPPKKDNGG
jgi:hypothetical protein